MASTASRQGMLELMALVLQIVLRSQPDTFCKSIAYGILKTHGGDLGLEAPLAEVSSSALPTLVNAPRPHFQCRTPFIRDPVT